MATEEPTERAQVDREQVKEALREILNEIPLFRAMAQHDKSQTDPTTTPDGGAQDGDSGKD